MKQQYYNNNNNSIYHNNTIINTNTKRKQWVSSSFGAKCEAPTPTGPAGASISVSIFFINQ